MRTFAGACLAVLALASFSSPAFAKKAAADKSHHCVGADGSELTAANAKACKKLKGKWEKGSAAAPAPAPAAGGDAAPPAAPSAPPPP